MKENVLPRRREVEREKKERLLEDMDRIEAEADFVELALERLQDDDDCVISSDELRKRLPLQD